MGAFVELADLPASPCKPGELYTPFQCPNCGGVCTDTITGSSYKSAGVAPIVSSINSIIANAIQQQDDKVGAPVSATPRRGPVVRPPTPAPQPGLDRSTLLAGAIAVGFLGAALLIANR